VKPIPVISKALSLTRSNVIVVAPPGKMTTGSKDLVMLGGEITVNVPVPAAPVPALAVVIFPVLFTLFPGESDMTGTTMEQLPDADIVPLERANDAPPLVIVIVPPQVFVVGLPPVLVMPVG
jgi:hypothetical protein